jgi:hypothetical protein
MCIIHSYTAHCTALTKKARKLQTPNPRKKTDSPSSRYACLAICIVLNRPESRDGSNPDCSPDNAPAGDLEMPWVCTLVFITSKSLVSISHNRRETKVDIPNGNTEAQVTTPAIPPHSKIVIHSGFSVPVLSDIKTRLLSS